MARDAWLFRGRGGLCRAIQDDKLKGAGWPLEWTEIIIIFVPIFLPMLKHFGIDPILWGTLVFVNLQAAFLSPPVAMSAFYLKGVAPKHVTLNRSLPA